MEETNIWYQNSTENRIIQLIASNDFEDGIFTESVLIAPGDEVRSGSPVAVPAIYDDDGIVLEEVSQSFLIIRQPLSLNGLHRSTLDFFPPTTFSANITGLPPLGGKAALAAPLV